MVKYCDEALRSFGINNLVAFRQPCVLTQISNYLPLLKRTRNIGGLSLESGIQGTVCCLPITRKGSQLGKK